MRGFSREDDSPETRRELVDPAGCGDFTEMCCGTEAGSYLRRIDSCITQLKAQGPSGTCNESKEKEEKLRGGGLRIMNGVGGGGSRGLRALMTQLCSNFCAGSRDHTLAGPLSGRGSARAEDGSSRNQPRVKYQLVYLSIRRINIFPRMDVKQSG